MIINDRTERANFTRTDAKSSHTSNAINLIAFIFTKIKVTFVFIHYPLRNKNEALITLKFYELAYDFLFKCEIRIILKLIP